MNVAERIVNFDNHVEKAKVLGYFRNLTGKHRLTVVKHRKRRSDQANAYMWAVCVPYVAAGLQEACGEQLSNDEVHEFLKNRFLAKPIVNRHTGESIGNTVPSSAALTTEQFFKYIEDIAKFAAEYLNTVIPLPNEQFELNAARVGS